MACLENMQKNDLFLEGVKGAFSLTLSVLGKCFFFGWYTYKITKHYKNRGFSRHMVKTPNGTFGSEGVFWEGPRKGLYYLWYTKLCSAESTILLCFQENKALQKIECKLKITEIYQTLGAVCQHAKRCFLGGGFGFLLCFCSFLVPSLKSFSSSYSVFSLSFFCHPFPNSIFFFVFLSINPFLDDLLLVGSSVFHYLPFPLLMFACCFETNFPNLLFLQTQLALILVVCFSLLFLFCYHALCFCISVLCWLVFGVFFFCYCLVFVLFLVLLSDYGNVVPLQF